jgi:hypothetical protein
MVGTSHGSHLQDRMVDLSIEAAKMVMCLQFGFPAVQNHVYACRAIETQDVGGNPLRTNHVHHSSRSDQLHPN